VAAIAMFSLAVVQANKENKTQLGLYLFECRVCWFTFATPSLEVAAIVIDVHDSLHHQPANQLQES
jgi:hypothetical protein